MEGTNDASKQPVERSHLKALSRHRLLTEMVTGVTKRTSQDAAAICAMVIDRRALKVLSASCKAYDMIEDGVVVWEALEKARQPLPELDVIYFLSPSPESVQFLIEDFENDKRPKYRDVHIFFTSSTANSSSNNNDKPSQIAQIASARALIPRIKSFVELNLAFVAYEKRVFHLDMPDSLPKLYHPYFANEFQATFSQIADRLATLFTTFGDIPSIRYHAGHPNVRLCETLAQMLHMRVLRLKDVGPSKFTHQQSQIVIIDRSFDISPMLMHANTFQGLLYDVRNIGVCSLPDDISQGEAFDKKGETLPKKRKLDDVYSLNTVVEDGIERNKEYILNDSNDVYGRHRHKELEEFLLAINKDLRLYLHESKAHRMRNQTQQKEESSMQDLLNGIRDMPQYRAITAEYQTLINLSLNLQSDWKQNGGPSLNIFEHQVATGVTEDGRDLRKGDPMQVLCSFVEDTRLSTMQKIRIVLLYLSNMRGVSKEHRDLIFGSRYMTGNCMKLANKFFACPFSTEVTTHSNGLYQQFMGLDGKDDKKSEVDSKKHRHKVESDVEKFEREKKRVKAMPTKLYFKPEIRTLLEDIINDELPPGSYPYVAQPDHMQTPGAVRVVHADATGLKAKDKVWDFSAFNTDDGGKDNRNDANLEPSQRKKKIVIFVIGGISFCEMEHLYTFANMTGTDLYLGSTAVYTPNSFLDALDRFIPDDLPAQGSAAA